MKILSKGERFIKLSITGGALAMMSLGWASEQTGGWELLVSDPLVSGDLVPGQSAKHGLGGAFSEQGWRATKDGDFLKIEVSETAQGEGALEVDLSGIVWEDPAMHGIEKRKIHFLNMFSNPLGDHHAEDGGTATDALWTLRVGVDHGRPRYGNGFKTLWSSRGAKRSADNFYHERRVEMPEGWVWDPDQSYCFRVEWSRRAESLKVLVDGHLLATYPWRDQQDELDTIFLGKAADFGSWVGPHYRNLRLWRRQ